MIVLKLSLEVNRAVEHEYTVLHTLNKIRPYCPNFVATLGLLPGYVNREFYESDKLRKETVNLFAAKDKSLPINYLLLEYVSDIDFKHVIKYADKTTVTGVLLGVLCAIQIAQNKVRFTHYDLHTGNILMRRVEEDSHFAYVIDGEVVVFPTGGWFPVLIDMGSSYIEGQQSTLFDRYADIHHFVLHAISYLEKMDTQSNEFCRHFRLLAGRCMHMFRYFDVWRYKGWKKLPIDISRSFYRAVNILETICLGAKLPWRALSDAECQQLLEYYYPQALLVQSTQSLIERLTKDPLVPNGTVIIYALRALVELGHSEVFDIESKTFTVPKEAISKFKVTIQYMYNQLHEYMKY